MEDKLMKIALITGASAGLGEELLKQAVLRFPAVEEFWLVARSREKLEALAASIPEKRFRILALDLCREESFEALREALGAEKPALRLLINNAGCGYLNNIGDGALAEQTRMVDLNVRALTAVTHLCLPYMDRGARIINISSIASFCPNPRMTVYSATKAYVSFFSRGLLEEVRGRGIFVTAVCPGPMDTGFLTAGRIKGNSKTFSTLPYCKPAAVAEGAVRAAVRGQAVYTPRAFYKFYRVAAKLLPAAVMVKAAKT